MQKKCSVDIVSITRICFANSQGLLVFTLTSVSASFASLYYFFSKGFDIVSITRICYICCKKDRELSLVWNTFSLGQNLSKKIFKTE